MEILKQIQQTLSVPKNQFNSFGKYPYRSCEDILEAVKPLLGDAVLTISDEIVLVGDRVYVKATSTIKHGDESISVSAFAREDQTKKGMDLAQLTGSCSSYARKYSLGGLFLIDDTKDADTQDNRPKKAPQATEPVKKKEPTEDAMAHKLASRELRECKNKNETIFNTIANNLGHKKGFSPADLSLSQLKTFIDTFIARDK